jgi:hypothetical protein
MVPATMPQKADAAIAAGMKQATIDGPRRQARGLAAKAFAAQERIAAGTLPSWKTRCRRSSTMRPRDLA